MITSDFIKQVDGDATAIRRQRTDHAVLLFLPVFRTSLWEHWPGPGNSGEVDALSACIATPGTVDPPALSHVSHPRPYPIVVGGGRCESLTVGRPTIRYAAATRQFNLPAGWRIKPRSSHTGGGGRTRTLGGARTLALGLTRYCINGPPNVFYTDREGGVMCSCVYKH